MFIHIKMDLGWISYATIIYVGISIFSHYQAHKLLIRYIEFVSN